MHLIAEIAFIQESRKKNVVTLQVGKIAQLNNTNMVKGV